MANERDCALCCAASVQVATLSEATLGGIVSSQPRPGEPILIRSAVPDSGRGSEVKKPADNQHLDRQDDDEEREADDSAEQLEHHAHGKQASIANRPIIKMARNMTFSETVTLIPTIQRPGLFHEREREAGTT